MKTEGEVALRHRRNWVEGERLVTEFEQSELERKAFCAAHGLSVHTLDAWRSRVRQSERREKIVPVEIVDDAARGRGSTPIARTRRGGQFRIVLAEWIGIEGTCSSQAKIPRGISLVGFAADDSPAVLQITYWGDGARNSQGDFNIDGTGFLVGCDGYEGGQN